MAKKIGLDTSKKKNENIIDTLTKQVQQKKASQLLGSQPVKDRGTQAGEITKSYISSMNRGSANTPLVSGINERKTSDIFDTLLNGRKSTITSKPANNVDALMAGKGKAENYTLTETPFKEPEKKISFETNPKQYSTLDQLLNGKKKDVFNANSIPEKDGTEKKPYTEAELKRQSISGSSMALKGMNDDANLKGPRPNMLGLIAAPKEVKTAADTGIRDTQAGVKKANPEKQIVNKLAETESWKAAKSSGKQQETGIRPEEQNAKRTVGDLEELKMDYFRGNMPEKLSPEEAENWWSKRSKLREAGMFDPEDGDTYGLMNGDYSTFSPKGRERARNEWNGYIEGATELMGIINGPENYSYATALSEDGTEVTADMLKGWKSDTTNKVVSLRYPGKKDFNIAPGLLWFINDNGDDLTVHFEDAQQGWVLSSFYDTINGEGAYQRATNLMSDSEKAAFDGKILRAVAATGLIDSDDRTEGLQGSIDYANNQLGTLDYWDRNDAEYAKVQPGATVDGYDQLHAERKMLLDERNSMNPSDPRREELDRRLEVVNNNINDIAEYNAESRSIMERDDLSGEFDPNLDVQNDWFYNVKWFEETGEEDGTPQEIYSFVNGGKVRQAYDENAGGGVSRIFHNSMMMTEEEREKFNRLYESDFDPDKPRAMAYLNALQPYLMRRYTEWSGARNRQMAEEHPVAASLANRLINFFAPVAEVGRRIAGDWGNKSVNDPNSRFFDGMQFMQDTEGVIISNLQQKYGDVAVLGYQAGMSIMDDTMRQLATMGLAGAGLIGSSTSARVLTSLGMFAGQAYPKFYYDALQQTNGDVEKATAIAYLKTGVEIATEIWSTEALMSEGKGFGAKLLKSGVAEGSEEIVGAIAEPFFEKLLFGKNEYERQTDEIWTAAQQNGGIYYDENGNKVSIDNYGEALKYVTDTRFIPEILNSAAAGFIGGAVGAAGVEGFNTAYQARTGRNILSGTDMSGEKIRNGSGKTSIALETVLTVGENMGEDTESKQRADNLRTRIRDGEKLRARDVGKLVESIYVEGSAETAKESERIYANVIASELKEKGVEEDRAKAASELIAKARVEGTEALTKAEKQQLMQDETAYQTYLALLKNGNASAEGNAIAAKAEKSASEAPTIAEKIEGTQMSIGMQRRLKYLNEQVRADSVSKEAQMATDKQLKTAIGNRTGTAADVVVGNRIGQVTGFKEDAKTGEILATVQFDDGTEDVGLSEVYGTDSNVAGLVKYAQVFKGSMTPEYLTAAVRTAQELGENINDKYLAEAERISLAAWFGESMPTVSMEKTAAENLYKIAQAEQQAAEDRRTQNPAQALNPGKGRSVFNGVEYGSKGWKAELNKLPENIRRNDINVLAELNRRLGFDLVFVNNPNDTSMFGYENGNTGRITVNLAAMNANEKGRSYLTIAGHEFTHWLQNNSKAGYAALRNFIIKSYRQEGKSVENMVLDKLASYQSGLKARADEETAALREKDQNAEAVKPQRFVLEDAIYEVIAEASDQVLASDEMAKRLQAEDPNLYGKFKQFVKNFFSNLKQAIGYMRDSGSISRESAALMRAEIREGIAKHWLAAYDEAMGVERPTEYAEGEDGKINYSQAESMVAKTPEQDLRYGLADKRVRDYLSSWARSHIQDNNFNKQQILERYGIKEGQLAESNVKMSAKDRKALENIERENEKWEQRRIAAMGLDEDDLGAQYIQAWKNSDFDRMGEILMEKMSGIDGIIAYKAPNWYDSEQHRYVAKAIKTKDRMAIARAAFEMSQLVPKNAVLIPMPPHTGKVTEDTDTMVLARAISELTKRPVVNALESDEHMSRKEAKEKGIKLKAEDMGFRQVAEIPEGMLPIFIDNVVGTGETAKAAHDAMGKGITLAYAKSSRAALPTMKNADPTYLDPNHIWLIPLDERYDMEKKGAAGLKYSFSDDEYMKAVENGDTAEMQRMVNEAAKAAGYDIKAWHGSDAKFTEFKPGSRREMWFASSDKSAYGRKHMYSTFLKINNPYEVTYDYGSASKFDPVEVTEKGRMNGHDGAIVHFRINQDLVQKNIRHISDGIKATDSFGDNFMFIPSGQMRADLAREGESLKEFMERGAKEDLYQWYVVYNPSQIKSADPVTYDNDGNVIPLSERFNQKSDDIRYSLATTNDGTKYVVIDTDQNIFDGYAEKDYPKVAQRYIKDHFRGKVVGINNTAYVSTRSAGEYSHPAKQKGQDYIQNKSLKMRASTEIDNIVEAGRNKKNHYEPNHTEYPGGFDLYDVNVMFTDKNGANYMFEGKINIGVDKLGRREFYDVTQLKSVDAARWINQHGGAAAQSTRQRSMKNITQNNTSGNSKISHSFRESEKIYKSLNISPEVYFTGTMEQIDAAEKAENERAEEFKQLIQKNGLMAMEFIKKDGRREILSHSLRKGIEWQLSYFGNDGLATMHENYGRTGEKLQEEAAVHSMDELYKHFVNLNLRGDITFHILEDDNVVSEASIQKAIENPKKSFSMKTPVEATEGGRLLAVHNLEAENLMKSIQLGGFPMPSIAIIKDDYAHNRYGDTSVIFYPSAIDPKASKNNKVYSGDAWTPTYPYVEYKLSENVLKKVNKKISSLIPENILKGLTFSSLDETNLSKSVNSARGDIVKAVKDNKKLKLAYMLDSGEKIDFPMREKRLTNRFENKQIVDIVNELGKETVTEAYMSGSSWFDEHPDVVEKIRKIVADAWMDDVNKKLGPDDQRKLKVSKMNPYSKENWGFSHNYSAIEGAWKYLNRGIEQELDESALDNVLKQEINEKEYEKWIEDQFSGIIEKSGIRNNKPYYTNSGNPRSWEALHDEETLDNIVKVMRGDTDKGSNAFFSQSEMLAVGTRDFKSLDEIRKHKGQLKHISEEEMSAAKTNIVNEFGKLMDEMADKSERNIFIARDRALQAMVEAARKSRTPAGIVNELKQWHGLNLPADAGERIANLLEEIANLPTEYFEGKPRRAVGLNEIAKVVIPETASEELKNQLDIHGIAYETYDGTDEDRLEKLNSGDNYHFSMKTPGDLDINKWMMTVTPGMLRTDAERKLQAEFKGMKTKIDIERERQIKFKNELAVLEAKDQMTPKEKSQADGLKIRIQNSQKAVQQLEEKWYESMATDGYANLMYNQHNIMEAYTSGKTVSQVRESVEAMQRKNEEAQKDIEKLRAELTELAESKEVRRIRALVNNDKLSELATRLRKDYNSSIDKQDLMNELARIRLKMQRGQDATEDVENLAGRIVDDMRPDADPILTQMRGLTIQVTPEQVKELKGRGESMKTIRSKLAGTGIKVKQGKVNTLVDNLSDLQERFGADFDFGGEKDALSNFADWVENRKYGGTETRDAYRQSMADVMSDVFGTIAQVEMNLPKDKATRDQFMQLFQYVEEIAKRAEKGAEVMAGMKAAMQGAIESGKSAAVWTDRLRDDVDATIEYFNRTAQLAEETAQSRRVREVIEQLKNKHVEEMLKKNEEWRNLIERDRNARMQNEANNAKRRMMTTVTTRLMKLLSSPKGTNVIPEHMNGLARELIGFLVDNDLSGGRKITGLDHSTLMEYKRRLIAWEERDGGFDLSDLQLADEGVTAVANIDLLLIDEAITEWNSKYNGKNKLDTLEQMGETIQKMQNAVSELYSIIKNEQSIAIGDRRVLVADQAYKVQQAINGKKYREWNGKAGKAIAALHKAIVSGNMTPEYFFRTLRNEGMWDLWEEFHKAENRNGLELARSRNRLEEIAKKHGYSSWDMGERKTLEMANGDKVSMTIGQLMSLYATWNREKKLGPEMSHHLTTGGFYVEESDPNKGIISRVLNEKRAHRVTEADMAKVNELLTEEQRGFVNDVVEYMSSDMSDLGNEASMKAYGIKMYKEKYYFPFKIWDGVKSRKSNDSGSGANIDQAFHPSFSHARMHNANNALILGDFMQTAADHIAGMINYATMGLANETMQKVLNHKEQADGSGAGEGTTVRNVRAMLEEAYGRTAMHYLEDLKTQLNGGAVRIDRTFYDKLISLFRKNAVAGSLSVAAQQPLSFIRAAMLIDPKYLARALAPDMWRGSYKEMMEHSGVAVIKEMGRFDMNAGQSAREYLLPDGFKGKGRAAYDKAVEMATMLPERMDRMTWTRMWSAVKAEQMALNPKEDPKSEAFLDKVATRFNEVMRRTQVYDSVLVRSRNMRNPNPAVKGITSFMAEPTLTLNVLADSVRMAIQGEKGGKAMAAKAGATFMLSAVLQSVIKAIFSTGRSPDEKKTFLENFLYRLESNLVSELNPISMIPGYSDLVNVLENGKIEDDALGVIGKIFSAGETIVNMLVGKPGKGVYRDIEDSAGQLAQIFTGIPVKNIMRDMRAMFNWFTGAPYADRPTNPNVLKYQGEAAFWNADTILGAINARLGEAGFETKNTAYYERIYEAKKAGDEKTAAELTDYLMTAKGVKGNTITSGVKAAAKADESATVSERAGIISSAGADPNDYVLDLVKGGKLGEGEALKILKEQNPDTEENDLWWKVDRAAYYRDTGRSAGSGEYYRFHDAIEANDTKAIRAAVGDLTAHGKTNAQIRTNIKSQYKEKYLKLPNGKQKIALKNALIMAYKATGMTEAEAEATINGWKAK